MSSGALASVLGTLLHLLCYRKVYLSSITRVECWRLFLLCICVFAELERVSCCLERECGACWAVLHCCRTEQESSPWS